MDKFIDTVMNQKEIFNYLIEFLNSIDLPGMPTRALIMRIRVSIILL